MIVVALIGLTLSLGVPAFVTALHKEGMRKAQADLMEALIQARGQAILTGKEYDWSMNPNDRSFQIPGGASVTMPSDIVIDILGVNDVELEQEDRATVSFLPNGTSDEFVIVIHSTKDGSKRKITLDPVTASPDLESLQ